jgi:hypothetical protein
MEAGGAPPWGGNQTGIGCFVSDSYQFDCIRFVEELKERLARVAVTMPPADSTTEPLARRSSS